MSMNWHEIWAAIHGMIFGFIFLLGFSGALYAVYGMKSAWMTPDGVDHAVKRIKVYLWVLAISAWAAVITGAYIVYPWYRATPPAGTTDLAMFPRYLLLASEGTAGWHRLGMEWKEHVAFLAPIAATVVAFVASYYGPSLATKVRERRAVMLFFVFAFATASIAGLFGAFITKYAPVR